MEQSSRSGERAVRSSDRAEALEADPWNAAVAGERPLDVARYPTAFLLRVANVMHFEGAAVYARRHGLTLPQWRLLHRLQESGPLGFSELCTIAFFDKAQASRVLGELQRIGMVSMTKDPAHRQKRIADITEAGRALADAILPEALAEQHRLLNLLSEEERRITFGALCKLLAGYGYELPPPPNREAEPKTRDEDHSHRDAVGRRGLSPVPLRQTDH